MGVVSGIVGAAASVIGGKSSSDAAKSASKAQERTANKNLKAQEKADAQMREDFAPWREYGERNLAQLDEMMKAGAFDPTKFQHNLQTFWHYNTITVLF